MPRNSRRNTQESEFPDDMTFDELMERAQAWNVAHPAPASADASVVTGDEQEAVYPATAVDTFYGMPFPKYEDFEHFVLHELHERNPVQKPFLPVMQWYQELNLHNYNQLARIFEGRVSPAVVRDAGKKINSFGGKQAMVANFYMYCHFAGERLKDMGVTESQFIDLHRSHARNVEEMWDGIGGWRY